MARIPTKAHAVLDYATGAALLVAPSVLGLGARSSAVLRGAGAGTLLASALTDYELGIKRVVPMKAHLGLDAAGGALLASSPWLLRTKDDGVLGWLPHVLVGVGEILGAAATEPVASDRRNGGGSAAGGEGTGSPTVGGVSTPPDPAHGGPVAADRATPPPETPGPSVTPPRSPMSETEREEHADALQPEHLPGEPGTAPVGETRVEDEAAAAAAEAAMIGGPAPGADEDPEMRPVREAGGGEQEGFEEAEKDLIENASHGDGGANPLRDAFSAEAESDLSGARYADQDNEQVSEVVEDVGAREDTTEGDASDDPGAGPGITHER